MAGTWLSGPTTQGALCVYSPQSDNRMLSLADEQARSQEQVYVFVPLIVVLHNFSRHDALSLCTS